MKRGRIPDVGGGLGGPTTGWAQRIASIASHFAIINAWYAGSCVLVAAALTAPAGRPLIARMWMAAAFAALLAQSVYLLDRAQPVDAMVDPADAVAHPDRMAWLWPRRWWVRAWMWAAMGSAAAMGAALWWGLAVVAPCAWIGALLYTSRRFRRRAKDVLGLKNALVGASHAALAGVSAAAARGLGSHGTDWRPVAWAIAALFLVVCGDAALCDIGDAESDRAHGTRSIAVVGGDRAAWAVAWATVAAACLVLGVGARRGVLAAAPAWSVGVALAATQCILALTGRGAPRSLRDLVDLRLGVVALGALVSRA